MEVTYVSIEINKTCPVCLEDISLGPVSILDSCSHSLCETCFMSHLEFSDKCPLCSKIFKGCLLKSGDSIISSFFLTEDHCEKIQKNRRKMSQG
jgi:hypothetical protein